MDVPTRSYLSVQGVLSKSCQHSIKDENLVLALKAMLKTREIDARMQTLQRQGTISFAMSSRGEEGCVVASAAALKLSDWLYPQYRECGILFWRGYAIEDFVHHMFCNGKDRILGRQMPNHFGDRDLNVVTVSSPVGTQIPHAAGAAYGLKLKGEKSVSLVYFGEGTASQGDFHVGANFAAVRKAPVIFFCRNNGYAISTPVSSQFAAKGIAERGIGYGMETYRVDGNDFFAVHEAVSQARELCLKGKGPVLIEAMTYRIGAHSTSDDPSRYRSDEEVKKWEKRCPIRRLALYLKKKKLWNDKEEKAYLGKLKDEIDAAIQMAKKTPPAPLDTLIEDTWLAAPKSLREQWEEVVACRS